MAIGGFLLSLLLPALCPVHGQYQASFLGQYDVAKSLPADSCGLGEERCLISRTDVVPCNFMSDGIRTPGPNEYGIYKTRFQNGPNGCPQCQILAWNYEVRPVQVIGSTNRVITIFSPGLVDTPPVRGSYGNNLYVEYNIQCGQGRLAYIHINTMNLEPKTCWDPSRGELRCVDYVQVKGGQSGDIESCGDDMSMDHNTFLRSNLRVIFRSSPSGKFPGFSALIVCFEPEGVVHGMESNFALSTREQRQLDELTAPHFDIAREMARKRLPAEFPQFSPLDTPDQPLDLTHPMRPTFSSRDILRALVFEHTSNPVLRAAARSITEDLTYTRFRNPSSSSRF